MATLNAQRVICSTITFRHLPLGAALRTIAGLGFSEIDLGALPGVCDHVPYVLDDAAVEAVSRTVVASGLVVRSVNADVGDLNAPLTRHQQAGRDAHFDHLIDLCVSIGSRALVLPNGRQSNDPILTFERDVALVADQLIRFGERANARGIELWVEAPHFFRLCSTLDLSAALYALLPRSIGAVCDVSHIVASGGSPPEFLARFGDRTTHVHLRDAELGYIHHSIGNGVVDFPGFTRALQALPYGGALALELETRDITNDERPAAALAAGEYISGLLS